MKLSSSFLTSAAAAAFVILPLTSVAQDANPYDGFKVPPLEVSSEFPYDHKFIEILGSQMAYVDEGEGDPILFLHGQPTSSYLWRNIMPLVEGHGRIIAPDNIGFGKSDQPELEYTFGDHYAYFEAFVTALELENITLVAHDWGSGLGLHFAAQNPDKIKGIVTMESILAPLIPAASYEAMPEDLANFFRAVRDPETGRKLLIEDNFFVEGALPGFIVRPLAEETLDVYRAPFLTEGSRIQVNQWPNEMPIGGDPAATTEIVANYNAFLEGTDIPWLFLYATPGALNTPEVADYWAARYDTIVWYDMPGVTFTQGEPPFPHNDRPRPTSRGSCRCSTRASRWSFCTTRSPLGPVGPNMPS